MRYAANDPTIKAVFDCDTGQRLMDVSWVEVDNKRYCRVSVAFGTLCETVHTAARMLVASGIIYINPPRGRPLPTVDIKGANKAHWRK